MLALGLEREVERLLDSKRLSERQIAKRLGISRGTVRSVAKVQRPTRTTCKKKGFSFFSDETPPARCKSCGAIVFMPCLLCHVRTLARHRRVIDGLAREPAAELP